MTTQNHEPEFSYQQLVVRCLHIRRHHYGHATFKAMTYRAHEDGEISHSCLDFLKIARHFKHWKCTKNLQIDRLHELM